MDTGFVGYRNTTNVCYDSGKIKHIIRRYFHTDKPFNYECFDTNGELPETCNPFKHHTPSPLISYHYFRDFVETRVTYYKSNGYIRSKVHYWNKDELKSKETFYTNGNKKMEVDYASGNVVFRKTLYYKNGNIKTYLKFRDVSIYDFLDEGLPPDPICLEELYCYNINGEEEVCKKSKHKYTEDSYPICVDSYFHWNKEIESKGGLENE